MGARDGKGFYTQHLRETMNEHRASRNRMRREFPTGEREERDILSTTKDGGVREGFFTKIQRAGWFGGREQGRKWKSVRGGGWKERERERRDFSFISLEEHPMLGGKMF